MSRKLVTMSPAPVILLGGGLRLLPEGVSSEWSLVSSTAMSDRAIAAHYRRTR